MRTLLTLVLVLALLPTAAAAQEESCTYDLCALRVEPGGFLSDGELVRGAAGEHVADFGFFDSDLVLAVAGSDTAVAYARRYQNRTRWKVAFGLAAAGVAAVPTWDSDDFEWENDWPWLVGGFVLGAISDAFRDSADRALSRAIWWHNAQYGR